MTNEFLDNLNQLQRNSIENLRSTLPGAHYAGITVRKAGLDHYFEADWLRDALDRLCDPSPNWKRAFLFARRVIDKLLDRHLIDPNGAVQILLVHHLRKTSELLSADVNGGLDEFYEEEVKALSRPPAPPPRKRNFIYKIFKGA